MRLEGWVSASGEQGRWHQKSQPGGTEGPNANVAPQGCVPKARRGGLRGGGHHHPSCLQGPSFPLPVPPFSTCEGTFPGPLS